MSVCTCLNNSSPSNVLICSFHPHEDVGSGAGGLIPTGQWTFPYFHQS